MVCCRFCLTAVLIALNPSGAVPVTDVMVNQSDRQVQKKPRRASCILLFSDDFLIFLRIYSALSPGCSPGYLCYHVDVDQLFLLIQQLVSDLV